MAQYSTSFDAYTVDVQPSDWTARWTTTNNTWLTRSKAAAGGGKCLENVGTTSNAFRLLTWDAVDGDANRANTEILARIRNSSSGLDGFRVTVRASGGVGTENSYELKVTGNSMRIEKVTNGVSALLGNTFTIPALSNVWCYVRFRANGTSLQGKFWNDGEAEPGWQVSATDSTFTAAGWVGVNGWSAVNIRDLDWFSVGTNGDIAPLSSDTATVIRVSQVVSEAALATVAPARISQLVTEVAISAPIPGIVSQMVVEVAFGSSVAVTQQPRMIVLM